ncbi:MAG: hypothetical protein JSW46_04615 [Gemmatimonadota bacterium]|nr:MAG: hypothetical protein JSW46_04615 [Gemmatimonadota bacterium]
MAEPRRKSTRLPARLREERGFALAMAIFALVLLAAVVAGGYYSASQEFQIGRGMRSLTASFYAGEAGIREVLNDWDPDVYFALDPGDTLTLSRVTLEGGSSYDARVVRVGRAADSLKRYFYIEAVGRPRGPRLGERRQAMVVRSRYPKICCQTAVYVGGEDMDFTGGKQEILSGLNTNPTGGDGPWPDSVCAGISTLNTYGAIIDSDVFIDDTTRVLGDPTRYTVDSSLQENVFPPSIGDLSYPEIVAAADFTLAPPDTFSTLTVTGGDLIPQVVNGKCDRSHPWNWGEPTQPNHPCFKHFPIIHFNGNLILESGSAQGILVVEGWLELSNFTFYGIVLVRDDIIMRGPSNFFGTGWAMDDVRYAGAVPRYYLSRCAAERAVRLSSLTRPTPVWPRAWVELF